MTLKFNFFLDIPSSYAKILEETNFQTREFPRSGSKAEGVGKKEKKKKKVGENNRQLRFVRHHGWRTQDAWTKIRQEQLKHSKRLTGGNAKRP